MFELFEITKKYVDVAYVLRLIPSYAFGEGLLRMASRSLLAIFEGIKKPRDVLDMKISGTSIVYLAVTSVGYMLLIFLVEKIHIPEFLKTLFVSKNAKVD